MFNSRWDGVTPCWGGQSTVRVAERDWPCSADSCPPVFGLAWSRADRWSVKWICYCLVCFGRSWKRPADYSPRCHCTHYRSALLLLTAVFFFCLFRLPCFWHFICIHTCLCTLGCLTSLTIQVLFKKKRKEKSHFKLLSIDFVAIPWLESLYCLSIFRFRYIILDDVLSFNLVMDFYEDTFLSYIFTSHSIGKRQV